MRARREQTTDCSAAMFRGLEPVGRRETPRQYSAAWRQTEDTLPAGGGRGAIHKQKIWFPVLL